MGKVKQQAEQQPLKLVVIAGPANTGKMPLARKLLAVDPSLVMVHRDPLRAMLTNEHDEAELTLLMEHMVRWYLERGRNVLQVSQNLLQEDLGRWYMAAFDHNADFQWLDVRMLKVAAMVPPMERV